MITCCVHHAKPLAKLDSARVRKTWRTPFEKAAGDDPETQYRWLQDIADSASPDVSQAFLDAVEEVRGTVKEQKLAAALETGSIDKVLEVLGIDEALASAIRTGILPKLEDVLIATGRQAPAETMPTSIAGGAMRMRFDIANPQVARYLQSYDFGLIQQIGDDTRAAIKTIVSNAMQYGGHPTDQAQMIRDLIGLTDNQAQAVMNFRTMLESGDREALTRDLRDRRFDPTLDRILGSDQALTDDQIDTMVERYGARMLDMRANNIARTETINAAEAGKRLAWEQAAHDGLLERTQVRQGWLVTPDDRSCIYCEAVPDMNPDGVPLGGYFTTPLGPVHGPTLHPQCRCALYLLSF